MAILTFVRTHRLFSADLIVSTALAVQRLLDVPAGVLTCSEVNSGPCWVGFPPLPWQTGSYLLDVAMFGLAVYVGIAVVALLTREMIRQER